MSHLSHIPGLPELIKKYGLKVFVETGCGNGDGLRHAKELGLEHRYSCDTKRESVGLCSHLGTVMVADSTTMLDFYVKVNGHSPENEPVLFWLDAHFPEHYGVFEAPGQRFPLLDELKIIATKPYVEHDVIVCDDMNAVPDCPFYNPDAFHKWPVSGVTVDALVAVMSRTHTHKLCDHPEGGFLIFEPHETPGKPVF